MKVYDIEVHGIDRALRGLARSYDRPIDAMERRALKLAPLDRGHNKFLRAIQIWAEVEAPRFWWAEYDTYKIGTVAQSDSTMHTLNKTALTQCNFEYSIPYSTLDMINGLISQIKTDDNDGISLWKIKSLLPEGFIQGRSININYAVLREMTMQRYSHRLPQWQLFLSTMLNNISNIELLGISNEILDKLDIK